MCLVSFPHITKKQVGLFNLWLDHVVFYLLVLLLTRSVQLLGSGGVGRVVTGPWVRGEWGPVRIRGSSWGPPNPSLRPSMARSHRVLPTGAVFGAICAASRKWWCQTGRVTPMGPS